MIERLADAVVAARGATDAAAAVVVLAGPVSVGKSRLAADLAGALAAGGTRVEVVSTDGFLHPNAWLVAHDLMARKGFPESYDVAALRSFVATVGVAPAGLAVPGYSHDTYDVLPEPERSLGDCDVVVLEGVNALSATEGAVDLAVYVDAAPDLLEAWYVERFLRLCTDPGPESFFARFADLDDDARIELARWTWRSVNVPNLVEHIGPSRRHAHLLVEKGPGHVIARIVELRAP